MYKKDEGKLLLIVRHHLGPSMGRRFWSRWASHLGFCFDEVDKKKTVVSIYKTRNRQIKKKKKKKKNQQLGKTGSKFVCVDCLQSGAGRIRGVGGIVNYLNLALGTNIMNMAKLGYILAWNLSSGFLLCHMAPCGVSERWSSLLVRTGTQMLEELFDIPGHTACCIIWEQFELCIDVTWAVFQELIAHRKIWCSKGTHSLKENMVRLSSFAWEVSQLSLQMRVVLLGDGTKA